MIPGFADLDSLPRRQLLAVAHDYMLGGFHAVKSLGVTVAMRGGLDEPSGPAVSIDQWMGASPVYTGRMREVMGIEGDDVPAIMKALQLDVGFCHEYMDVAYKVIDPLHGEFWLNHCGALIDIEPLGEARVFDMCHTIEDPTFDATALATNPRARIRPIHRPPRVPADRHPNCHWTLVIDPANDPVGAIPLTRRMAELELAQVPNRVVPRGDTGRPDYRGEFDPGFRLRELSEGAMAAVSREFQMQAHLLAASLELTMIDRVGEDAARAIVDEAWLGASWVAAERLPRILDLGTGAQVAVAALHVTPMLPPGFDREVTVDGDRITCVFTPIRDGLLDSDHPGWCGSLARGATGLIEGTLGGLGYKAEDVSFELEGGALRCDARLTPAEDDRVEPDVLALGRIGRTAGWQFDLTDIASS